jgi:hypothetical protein
MATASVVGENSGSGEHRMKSEEQENGEVVIPVAMGI